MHSVHCVSRRTKNSLVRKNPQSSKSSRKQGWAITIVGSAHLSGSLRQLWHGEPRSHRASKAMPILGKYKRNTFFLHILHLKQAPGVLSAFSSTLRDAALGFDACFDRASFESKTTTLDCNQGRSFLIPCCALARFPLVRDPFPRACLTDIDMFFPRGGAMVISDVRNGRIGCAASFRGATANRSIRPELVPFGTSVEARLPGTAAALPAAGGCRKSETRSLNYARKSALMEIVLLCGKNLQRNYRKVSHCRETSL